MKPWHWALVGALAMFAAISGFYGGGGEGDTCGALFGGLAC